MAEYNLEIDKSILSKINTRQQFLLATSLRFERCWCSQWYYYRHAVIIIIRMSFSNLPPTQKEEKSFADTIRKRKEEKRLQLLRRSFLLVWFWCITGIIAFLAYWNKLRNYLCWFLKYRYIFRSCIRFRLKTHKMSFATYIIHSSK